MASLAGTQIDKYDMIEEVGHGGMAVVYRGLDRVLKREVAVKVLHPHLADRKESRLRLQREAIAVAKLRHENILEIFDYSGPEAAESYIVTEFIHGMTLKDWVDKELDPRPAVSAMIVHRLCLALQHAHSGGIVHRDIKPENVMIRNDGVLKLMDFGIAQIIDNQKLTLTGQLIGSPAYMAPELISGRPLDRRTDLFSLGILLYQLATGQLPFSGRNPHEVLNRIADGDYPPAATICPLVDRELEDIIALALASDPDDRYQSVKTFGEELARYLDEVGVEPSNAELGRYFADPEGYVAALDPLVCTTLTRRARAAAEAGETSRAIRLLGRVLEIDGNHAGANALLQKLQRRERRNRAVAWIAGGTLAAAAAVLAFRFLPSGDPRDEGPSSSLSAASLERTDRKDRPVVPAASTGPGVGVEASAAGSTTGGSDSSDGTADGGSSDTDTGGTTEVAVVAGDGRPDRIRRPRSEGGAAKPPEVTPCTLVFSGIPLPTAKNLGFSIGTQRHAIEAMQADVELSGDSTYVQIKDKRFHAGRTVTREQCLAGSVPVEIRPKHARVTFEGLPDNGVAIVCRAGCRSDLIDKNQTPQGFQPVPIPKGELQQAVTIVVKHPDLRAQTIERDLHPGPNTIRLTMMRVP